MSGIDWVTGTIAAAESVQGSATRNQVQILCIMMMIIKCSAGCVCTTATAAGRQL